MPHQAEWRPSAVLVFPRDLMSGNCESTDCSGQSNIGPMWSFRGFGMKTDYTKAQ